MAKSKVDIWMPLFIGDYMSATGLLTQPEHGAYLPLLMHQWRTGKALPNDLYGLVELTKSRFSWVNASSIPQECIEHVRSMSEAPALHEDLLVHAWLLHLLVRFFVQDKAGGWWNPRVARDLTAWNKRQEIFENRARNAANKRWGRKEEPLKKKKNGGDATSIPHEVLELSPSSSPVKYFKDQRDFVPGSSRSTEGVASPPIVAPSSAHTKGEIKAKASKKARQAIAKPSGIDRVVRSASRGVAVAKIAKSDASSPSKEPPKRDRTVDPRFGPFRDEIFRAYESMYRAGLVRTSRPTWGPRERKEMNVFLESNPDVDFPIFRAALLNWSRSENANVAAPPHRWLVTLMSFSVVELDRYGHAPSKRRAY